MLQELLLKLARLLGTLQLVLEVDALQGLVLKVLLGIVQFLLQLGVFGAELLELCLVRVIVGLELVQAVLQVPLVPCRRLVRLWEGIPSILKFLPG